MRFITWQQKNVVERVYTQLTAIRWILGVGLTLISLMVAYGTFFAG